MADEFRALCECCQVTVEATKARVRENAKLICIGCGCALGVWHEAHASMAAVEPPYVAPEQHTPEPPPPDPNDVHSEMYGPVGTGTETVLPFGWATIYPDTLPQPRPQQPDYTFPNLVLHTVAPETTS